MAIGLSLVLQVCGFVEMNKNDCKLPSIEQITTDANINS